MESGKAAVVLEYNSRSGISLRADEASYIDLIKAQANITAAIADFARGMGVTKKRFANDAAKCIAIGVKKAYANAPTGTKEC